MILQAKKDSEARVRHDLTAARSQLSHMQAIVADLSLRVEMCAHKNGAKSESSQTVDMAFLTSNIAQLEQKWGAEVKALKQDLHRTILAHNHNSDLMRLHRDALEEARKRVDAAVRPKADEVDAQIEKVDRMVRAGQAKQRALDALTERLTLLEQQATVLYSSYPDPAAPAPPSFAAMLPPGAGYNAAAASTSTAAAKSKGKKQEEPPTDAEVRTRLLQAVQANLASSGQFNAEAPVFIPTGPATATPVAADEAAGGAPAASVADDDQAEEKAAGHDDNDEEGREAEAGS